MVSLNAWRAPATAEERRALYRVVAEACYGDFRKQIEGLSTLSDDQQFTALVGIVAAVASGILDKTIREPCTVETVGQFWAGDSGWTVLDLVRMQPDHAWTHAYEGLDFMQPVGPLPVMGAFVGLLLARSLSMPIHGCTDDVCAWNIAKMLEEKNGAAAAAQFLADNAAAGDPDAEVTLNVVNME